MKFSSQKRLFAKVFFGMFMIAFFATTIPVTVSAQQTTNDPSKEGFQLIPCDGVKKQKVDAQGNPVFTEPVKDSTGKVIKAGEPVYEDGSVECDFGQLKVLFNNILNFLLYLSIPLVLGMIMYTGFMYITANGDTGKLKKAKSMLVPVALGIFWVLAGFIVVKTVLSNFLADNIGGEQKESFINRFLGN